MELPPALQEFSFEQKRRRGGRGHVVVQGRKMSPQLMRALGRVRTFVAGSPEKGGGAR